MEKWLTSYTVAAGAAGVSVLALASPAQADIVYTAANIPVPQTACCGGPGVKLDLNHDGVNDFSVLNESYADFGPISVNLWLYAKNHTNGVEGAGRGFAARLESGATIGSSQKFAQFHASGHVFGVPLIEMGVTYTNHGGKSSFCLGPWAQPEKKGYLGIRFGLSDGIHYGWIRLTAGACVGGGRLQAIVTGYAYNTEPNQPIVAGQEHSASVATVKPGAGTLGQLALGSLGIPFWRREEGPSVQPN